LSKKKIEKDLLRIGLFIIYDALMFHEVLSITNKEIKSLRKAPPLIVTDFLIEEWKKIMNINYLPVFDLANKVLLSFPSSPETNGIIKELIGVALDIVSSGTLSTHDLMGGIYHKLLLRTVGKKYATYYTSTPGAWILANLAVKTKNPDLNWNFEKLENIKNLRCIDPACGSGTLLSGFYMALKDKYIQDRYNADKPEPLDLNNFHKIMLENVMYGWDILDFAGHLTLTTLALHNPKAIFTDSNIHTLLIGSLDKIYLGSLDYLDGQMKLIGIGFGISPKKKGLQVEKREEINIPKHSIDMVIMNPPFSRSAGSVNVKFGYEEKDIMKLMNKRLRELGRDHNYEGIGHAGLGAYFIVLSNNLLKEGGRLALVIPRAILSGVSWEIIRKKNFLEKYEVEYIVSNYDPGYKELNIEPWNWSENTNLGEVLLVAKKIKNSSNERYTTFINIWNKPKNELESLKIVSDSLKARQQKGLNFLQNGSYKVLYLNKEIGTVYNVSQKYLKENFLIPCLFAHPDLNKLIFKLIYNNLIPLMPLGQITDKLGVDRKQVRNDFNLVTHQTIYPILWGHPGNLKTIGFKPFQYAEPKNKNSNLTYSSKKANLLIAERIWTNTLRVISLFSPTPILATMFWEVSINKNYGKILSMWLNSTLGFILLLSYSINNGGNWFNIKKNLLSKVPVLDINGISNKKKVKLIEFYNQIKYVPFNPIPLEFELASVGEGIRKQLDKLFIECLDLDIDLKFYYKMLAKEPMITLRRL